MNYTAMTHDQIKQAAPSVFASRPFHEVSEKYAFIPTIRILEGLEREGFGVFKARQSNTRIEGKKPFVKHALRLRHLGDMGKEVGGSVPEIALGNDHAGGGALVFDAGIFEVLCQNGLVAAKEKFANIRIRHQGDDIINRVIEGAFQVVQDFGRVIEVRDHWKSIRLDHDEKLAFASAAHVLKWKPTLDEEGNELHKFDSEKLLMVRRPEELKDDLWTTFNVVQENMIKGGLDYVMENKNGKVRKMTTRGIKSVADDNRVNQALWLLADKMAELKA